MQIKVTKQQLIELQQKLNPLIKKALVGKPIKPVTHFIQGLVPIGEETIVESPDKVLNNYDDLLAHWSNDDAIGFGFLNDKAYISYNNELFFDSTKIPQEDKDYVDKMDYREVEKMLTHAGISKFYKILYGTNTLGGHRSNFNFTGRLWTVKRIITFWQYPDKNKLPQLLKSLAAEIFKIYDINIDFSKYKIEVKTNEYQADLDTNDEDYEPDIAWEKNQKIGNLIPIKDFISSDDATEQEMQNIHSLPSDEKRNTPQIRAARDADAERLGNKFNGNTSQAEWNNAKKKYQGESKTFKITSSQLNEIKKHLTEDTVSDTINDTVNCPFIKISEEIKNYINKFNTDEEFLRGGGLPVNMLDRIAFGFADEDIKTLKPKQLNVKWKDDLNNIVWEIKKSGLSQKEWANKVDLTEPIDVSYEKNKFYIEDGHHRYCAAKILGKDLNVNLEINMNPTEKIAPGLGYDNLCRCLFKQVKNDGANEGVNSIMMDQLTEQYVYHASVKPIDKIQSYSEYNKDKSGYYPGMYFFNNKEISKTFYDPSKYNIYKTNIDGLKLYDLKDGDELKQLASKNGVDVNAGSGYREAYWLESQGYDGIKRGKYEVILFNPENLNIEKVENIDEDIKLPVNVGDTVLMGKFKNKKTVVKKLDKDSHGMPTINGKQAATFRTIKEDKDAISLKYNGKYINLSNEDIEAVPFVYFNNKVYVGYTPYLGDEYVEAGYEDSNYETLYPNYHNDITDFYKFINRKNKKYKIDLPMYRNDFAYIGRIWLESNVVSFYKYPEDKSKMKQIMGLLSNEIYEIYGERFNFNETLVNTLGENGEEILIPINDYVGSSNASDEVINSPHLLSPEQKKNSPQLQAVKDYDNKKMGDKFNGNVSQAEWDAAKNKYRGESVDIKGTPLLEEFDPTNIKFKFSKTEDNYSVRAFENNTLIGSIESEDISQDYYQYEFEDVWPEDELDEIFPEYNICKINYLTVNSEYQKSGVAKKLLTMLLDKKRKDGFKQFYLNASPMGFNGLNVNSLVEFYKKFGFKILLSQGNNVLMGISSNNLTEATESDVNLSSFKPKNELNEKFWINEKIKPIIRKRLLKIADDFIDFLKIDIKKIEDVLFLGSLANYNWSKYSDIDLHLVIDMKKINKDIELVKDYFDAKKKVWSVDHDELKICGFPVEIYVQDKSEQNASVGMFSLEKNKWLNKPIEINDEDFNKQKIKEKAAKLMTDIDDLLNDYKNKPNFNQLTIISDKSKKLYDKIKRLRKQGLDSEAGETSVGNIVFKVLRRNEYLGKLIDLKTATYDKINSIK